MLGVAEPPNENSLYPSMTVEKQTIPSVPLIGFYMVKYRIMTFRSMIDCIFIKLCHPSDIGAILVCVRTFLILAQ
jgi:hypothetical protein